MRTRPIPILIAAIVAAVAAPAVVAGSARAALPYDLRVRVVLGDGVPAATTLADDLEAVLVEEILSRGCYRSVRGVDDDRRAPGDLVFKVRIDEVEDLVEHDVSLARRALSEDPQDRMRYDAAIRVRAETGLLAPASDRAVFSKTYRVRVTHRPRFVDEDTRGILRARLLDDFATRVAGIACSPSAARLDRWVRRADGEAR